MIFTLAGSQNRGRTILSNALTGSSRHVGSFPGVTVAGPIFAPPGFGVWRGVMSLISGFTADLCPTRAGLFSPLSAVSFLM